jgi:hypothetical protein
VYCLSSADSRPRENLPRRPLLSDPMVTLISAWKEFWQEHDAISRLRDLLDDTVLLLRDASLAHDPIGAAMHRDARFPVSRYAELLTSVRHSAPVIGEVAVFRIEAPAAMHRKLTGSMGSNEAVQCRRARGSIGKGDRGSYLRTELSHRDFCRFRCQPRGGAGLHFSVQRSLVDGEPVIHVAALAFSSPHHCGGLQDGQERGGKSLSSVGTGIRHVESGRFKPTLYTLLKIADAQNLNLPRLLTQAQKSVRETG